QTIVDADIGHEQRKENHCDMTTRRLYWKRRITAFLCSPSEPLPDEAALAASVASPYGQERPDRQEAQNCRTVELLNTH
ncbi:MAG: hypothetical protein KJZ78_26285, partial [Bryobacteraceae bacterium]|nr:hypothetical protein [Bryobacteraceae bacterium]